MLRCIFCRRKEKIPNQWNFIREYFSISFANILLK